MRPPLHSNGPDGSKRRGNAGNLVQMHEFRILASLDGSCRGLVGTVRDYRSRGWLTIDRGIPSVQSNEAVHDHATGWTPARG